MKYLFLFILALFFSCSQKDVTKKEHKKTVIITPKVDSTSLKDKKPFKPLIDNCLEKGELVVLLNNSSFSYHLYKGEPLGYEYELLSLFCKDAGLKLKVKVVKDAAHILDSLASGYGHLAAANITINTERKKNNHFTLPFFKTKQVLVQRLPANWRKMRLDHIKNSLIQDPLNLEGKTVVVKKKSAFYDRIESFSFENGLNIALEQGEALQTTEDLIGLVDKGEIDYTIADQNTAQFYQAFYQDLDFNTAISLNQNIAWAVNKSQTALLDRLNAWVKKKKGGMAFNILENKYFDISKREGYAIRKGWQANENGQISPYDVLIKENAAKQNMDWLLLTSLIFQESKFNPKAKSWVGARGLTQVMPATGKDLGVNNASQLYIPSVSIKAGSVYLEQLIDFWRPVVKDSVEANYFALASYNTGKGHVLDARRIAIRIGKDNNKWFGNVESALLLKSNPAHFNHPEVKYGYSMGKEPVQYVKNIMIYYARFDEYLREKIKD